ncbi:MAG TPA: tRNA (guanosine(46)-N7)-methyltransferase TrmB [Mesotoga sp.]|jgi:tRNA (guanine-N7-)-methyltransferase|nr:tRNA (guanosine(46)-N7)-methyltransferase TrmB [Mesotoga sp.]HRR43688.1 tRNA (guanosine(46)-N7)-methyltransferase TrmB [Mesotoga sp.]
MKNVHHGALMERKVDHFLGNFIDATEYELPLKIVELFHRAGPNFLEIGFGGGEFLIQMAQNKPEWNFVGLELSMVSCQKLLKSVLRKGLKNLRVLLIDAQFALDRVLPSDSFDGVYMNFPCPWPKKRHSGRRLNGREFMEKVSRVLKPGGFFQLYTDSEDFALGMVSSLESTGLYNIRAMEKNPSEGVNTRYEAKWLSAGRQIFRLYSTLESSTARRDVLKEEEMPHKWLSGEIDMDRLEEIYNVPIIEGESLVKFLRVFKSMGEESYLVETITVDNDYSQRFYINLVRKEAGWLVQLDSQAKPFRTPAVKLAVNRLASIVQQ